MILLPVVDVRKSGGNPLDLLGFQKSIRLPDDSVDASPLEDDDVRQERRRTEQYLNSNSFAQEKVVTP